MKDTVTNSADFSRLAFTANATFVEAARPAAVADDSFIWDNAPAKAPAPISIYRDIFKRLMDLTFILVTLPFSVTIIGLCALALWVESGNPFYTQDRLGKNGKRFKILKLRTMVRNADALLEEYLAKDPEMRREWDEIQKLRHDPRITRVGAVLRKTSLDELPQLVNVALGHMSLVGPRPMLPEQLEMYGEPSAYFALKPGITGLWQVSARNSARFNYRNDVDAAYERNLTLKLDLTILYKTIGVVFRPTGH